VHRDWHPLHPLLTGLAGEQTPAAQRKGIKLVADVEAARGLEVLTDRVRLGRLLSNLLVNAVRYTGRGEARLAAAWGEGGPGSLGTLVLSVSETAGGIAPDEQESIFHPYQRGRSGKEDSESGGSGIGLAVVDRLVNELDLVLELYSEFGEGSRF